MLCRVTNLHLLIIFLISGGPLYANFPDCDALKALVNENTPVVISLDPPVLDAETKAMILRGFPTDRGRSTAKPTRNLPEDTRKASEKVLEIANKFTQALNQHHPENPQVLVDLRVYRSDGAKLIEAHQHANEDAHYSGTLTVGRDGTWFELDGEIHETKEADAVFLPEMGKTGEPGPVHGSSSAEGIVILMFWSPSPGGAPRGEKLKGAEIEYNPEEKYTIYSIR